MHYERVEKLCGIQELCTSVPEITHPGSEGLFEQFSQFLKETRRVGKTPLPIERSPLPSNDQEIVSFAKDRELAKMNDSAGKKRTLELQLAANQILANSGADVSQAVAIRPLARALAKLSGCGYRTAVRHIELAIMHAQSKKTGQ